MSFDPSQLNTVQQSPVVIEQQQEEAPKPETSVTNETAQATTSVVAEATDTQAAVVVPTTSAEEVHARKSVKPTELPRELEIDYNNLTMLKVAQFEEDMGNSQKGRTPVEATRYQAKLLSEIVLNYTQEDFENLPVVLFGKVMSAVRSALAGEVPN